MPTKTRYRYFTILVSVGMGIGLALLGLFALGAGATRAAVSTVGVDLVKTVGTEHEVCATTKSIAVHRGTEVTYCYWVMNTGSERLEINTLFDDQLGEIAIAPEYHIDPGRSGYILQTAVITDNVTNIATWTGVSADSDVATDSDTATVTLLPPELELVKTVGLDRSLCAATDAIDVALGTEVTYCYTVHNTGTENLITHDLVDDQLGLILDGFPNNLVPDASAFLTMTAVISESVTNHATWSALSSYGGTASDEATARVTVLPPSLTLSKTVGTDDTVCAETDAIEVGPNAQVTYCYEVTNSGLDSLVVHDLLDDRLGTILTDFPYSLAPSASAFLTQTVVISESVINTATWSADTADGRTASGGDSAQVTVVPPTLELVKTVGLNPALCANTDVVDIEAGEEVTYCYVVRNTGISSLVTHGLVDDELGTLLTNFPYVLAPDVSVFITQTVVISNSVINTGTWSALTPEGAQASESDTARVLVAGDPLFALFLPMLNH